MAYWHNPDGVKMDEQGRQAARAIDCPYCGAEAGFRCFSRSRGYPGWQTHRKRVRAFLKKSLADKRIAEQAINHLSPLMRDEHWRDLGFTIEQDEKHNLFWVHPAYRQISFDCEEVEGVPLNQMFSRYIEILEIDIINKLTLKINEAIKRK